MLILHAWWGLNDTIRAVCTRLAEARFVAFAPDLYHGTVAATSAEAEILGKALATNHLHATAEIAAATRFLSERAYWHEWLPTSRIVGSYGNKRLFIGSYDTLFHLILLREAFIMLMVHAARENPHGIQDFITAMERALRYFFS